MMPMSNASCQRSWVKISNNFFLPRLFAHETQRVSYPDRPQGLFDVMCPDHMSPSQHRGHRRGQASLQTLLWTDIENIRTLYEGNTSEDNLRMGIFHEISYDAVIRGNVVRRNGFGFLPWLWGAGILVAASPNVEITGNTVEGNADGIVGVQQNRGSGMYGPFYISNLWVHDNVVRQTAGQSGLAQDIGDSSIFTGRNNRFERNTYQEACGNRHWAWANAERTWIEWRAAGQDAAGSCTP